MSGSVPSRKVWDEEPLLLVVVVGGNRGSGIGTDGSPPPPETEPEPLPFFFLLLLVVFRPFFLLLGGMRISPSSSLLVLGLQMRKERVAT